MFLKQKRCGKIKGRGFADGRKQRKYLTKDDTSVPTVATEALFLTCLIDATEHRKVATVDIPGSFMQSDMEGKTVHMNLEGEMAELLTKLDTKLYRKYVTNKKGRTVLYAELKKSLYGTLQAALLFQKNLTSILQEWGFEINIYDWCVANKTIEGKKMIVVWHVDNLKISQKNGYTVDSLTNKPSK